MIGQKKVQEQLLSAITEKQQRAILLVGARGAGKETLIVEVHSRCDIPVLALRNPKIDELRELIALTYRVTNKAIYAILDADKLSLQAQNTLLKVIEEPPNNAIFILTASNEESVLETIRSRSITYYLKHYSKKELTEYAKDMYDESQIELLLPFCYTPGDINKFRNVNVEEFYKYVYTVVDNIAVVSGSNAFKISSKINLKDDNDKYDLILFLRLFAQICFDRAVSSKDSYEINKYLNATLTTNLTLIELDRAPLNKQMMFDEWLLEVRHAWI